MIWKQNWGYNCIEKKGIAVSAMYNIECDYRYLYVKNRKGGTVNTIEGNSGDKVARWS